MNQPVIVDRTWRAAPRHAGRLRPHRHPRARRVVRLWLPLTPIFVLLAPLALIAAPAVRLIPYGRSMSPWRAAWAIGGLLLACSGTVIEVDSPRAHVSIRII